MSSASASPRPAPRPPGTEPDPWLVAADLLDPQPDPYAADPVGFVQEVLGEFLWSRQREIATSVRDHRYTAVPSAHDLGKSFVASRIAAWWLHTHPPGEAFVVSTAPSFAQVRAILWKEIGRAHRRGGLVGRINQTEWWIGREIVGMGRKPSDYDPDAFQGIHARYVLVIIDEAGGIPKSLWDAGDALVTNEESRILAIGNPDDPASHFAEVCKPGSGWNVIHLDGLDSPNFTGEAVPDYLPPLLLSPVWVEERRKRWGEDSPLFAAKVRGRFPETSTDTLIPPSWIARAQARELERTGPGSLGVDVARFGDDETVIGLALGPHYRTVARAQGQDTMETAGAVAAALRETKAEVAKVDVVGIGAGVVDRLAEQGLPVAGLNAGAGAADGEMFANARAEWYWGLRERFESEDVDLDPADEDLAAQLGQLKYRYTSRGQVQIESKQEMRRRGLPSPDHADTMMLAYAHLPPEDEVVAYDADVRISPY